MTLVNIDLRNQGYETSPGDRVVFYSLLVREGDFGTISTAPVEVELVDGKASVDLAPGPVGVQIVSGQVADTRVKEGRVPMEGPTTLNVVLTLLPEYSDAMRASFLAAIRGAQDEALTRIDTEVAAAVDSEVGEFKTKAEQALAKSALADSKSDTALSKSTTAESSADNAVSRVEALEVMGGLAPGEPVDGQTANLVAQPDSLTRGALMSASAAYERERKSVISVADFGAVPDGSIAGGTDNSDAFEAALDATPTGGTLYVPRGNYWLSRTFKILKSIRFWCDWTSTNGGNRGESALFFPPGVNGIEVGQVGETPIGPQGWEIGPFQLVSRSRQSDGTFASSEGIGILVVNGGKGKITRARVEAFGSHGIMLKSGMSIGINGNVNHCSLIETVSYRNGGDGIHLTGSNAQRTTLYSPDVVGNHGWGINVERADSNHIISAHADQQYYGSPGAFRDNATATYWDHPYSEEGAPILFAQDSVYGMMIHSIYGAPQILFEGETSQRATMIMNARHGNYRHVKIDGMQDCDVEMRMGAAGANTFDLNLISPSGLEILFLAKQGDEYLSIAKSLRPLGAERDVGLSWSKYRDGHFSRYVKADGAIQTGSYETGSRPTPGSVGVGGIIFDTTTNKTLTSTGTQWVDAMGNPA